MQSNIHGETGLNCCHSDRKQGFWFVSQCGTPAIHPAAVSFLCDDQCSAAALAGEKKTKQSVTL